MQSIPQMVRLDILQMQRLGNISSQHIQNLRKREEMFILDYLLMVSAHLESMEGSILYGQLL